MPKDVKRSIMQLRVTALTALAVASAIALAAFFAEPADASENVNNPQLMETTYETTEMQEESGDAAAGEHRNIPSDTNGRSPADPKYCFIVLSYDDRVPEIRNDNTIIVDNELCTEIGLLIMSHIYNET